MGEQTAVDDLADDVFRQSEKIIKDSGFLLRQAHGGFRSSTARSLARIARHDKSRRALHARLRGLPPVFLLPPHERARGDSAVADATFTVRTRLPQRLSHDGNAGSSDGHRLDTRLRSNRKR